MCARYKVELQSVGPSPLCPWHLRDSPALQRVFTFGKRVTRFLQSCLVATVLGPERFPGRVLLLRHPTAVGFLPLRVDGMKL
jgi:hypothetical protein